MKHSDEMDLRKLTAELALSWYETSKGEFRGDKVEDFPLMIIASDIVAEEARATLRNWINAGRRGGMSWADIGELMGISRQAAQQKFGSIREPEPHTGLTHNQTVDVKATAFDEERILQREGERGLELLSVGPFKLHFKKTKQVWEYRRVTTVAAMWPHDASKDKDWQFVAAWFPFKYFKRAV